MPERECEPTPRQSRGGGAASEDCEWAATFDAIDDMIAILDRNWRVVRANRSFLATFGAGRAELGTKTCHEIMHGRSAPCVNCLHQRTLETRQTQRFLCHNERLDRDFEIADSPVLDDAGKVSCTVHVIKDVTEQQMAEQVKIEKEKLEAVLEMARTVNHELNQPLQVVLGYAANLLARAHGQEDLIARLESIRDQAQRMREITRKLGRLVRYRTADYMHGDKLVDLDLSTDSAPEAPDNGTPNSDR